MKTNRKGGEAYCPACEKKVTFHWEDCGIGSYEYWGERGTDVDWQPVCDECEEFVDSKSITPDDREPEWEPDFNEDHWREDR